jgi:hypothetical protein
MSIFQDVFVKKPGRSLFNLSHEKKFTANFGFLYPFLVIDAVPGDTFKLSTEFFVRTAPLIAPVMHRINVKVNYFFVPNRLLWKDWNDFITGVSQETSYVEAGASYFVNPVKPFTKVSDVYSHDPALVRDGSLMDFLGFPTLRPNASLAQGTNFNIDLMPFYAYYKVYCDWFRNQNVQGGHEGSHDSGEHTDGYNYFGLRSRMYEKDYFTSALPFAQRGDAVPLPISGDGTLEFVNDGRTIVRNSAGQPSSSGQSQPFLSYDTSGELIEGDSSADRNIDNSSNLKANVNVGTINDLRIATRLQRWLEKNARVGGRYIEQILAHFGVHSSDARLQRAEYLGGFSAPIQINEVEQNSSTQGLNVSGSDTPQGHLAGKGASYGNSKPIKCFCEEHGFIIGLISILPRTSYQDGLPRMYTRSTRYDYYFPEFANLGEQEIQKSELFFDLSNLANQSRARFGFQERFCEYKYIPSTVHGEFKNNLQFWHLGRSFTNQPALNYDFVKVNNDNASNRIFAVEDSNVSDHFYVDLYNHVSALRPMPKQAIPTL